MAQKFCIELICTVHTALPDPLITRYPGNQHEYLLPVKILKVLRTVIANTVGKGPLHWVLVTQAAFPEASRRTTNLHVGRKTLDFSTSHGSPPSISTSYLFLHFRASPATRCCWWKIPVRRRENRAETELGKVLGLQPALKFCLVNSWFFSFLLSPFMLNGS